MQYFDASISWLEANATCHSSAPVYLPGHISVCVINWGPHYSVAVPDCDADYEALYKRQYTRWYSVSEYKVKTNVWLTL